MSIDLSPEALAELRDDVEIAGQKILALIDALEEARAEIAEGVKDRNALYKHLVTTRTELERMKQSLTLSSEITGEDQHESTFDRDRRRSWIKPHGG
jgi:predicted  nucleic acid-binding Zn-ribbon protein